MDSNLAVLFETSGSSQLKRWYNERLAHLEDILKTVAGYKSTTKKSDATEEAMTILKNLKPRISLQMLEYAANANFDEFIYYAVNNNLVDWNLASKAEPTKLTFPSKIANDQPIVELTGRKSDIYEPYEIRADPYSATAPLKMATVELAETKIFSKPTTIRKASFAQLPSSPAREMSEMEPDPLTASEKSKTIRSSVVAKPRSGISRQSAGPSPSPLPSKTVILNPTVLPILFSLPARQVESLPKDLLNKLPSRTNYTQAAIDKETKTAYVRTAYQPNLTPLTAPEDGREQKIYGRVPFFMQGESWPIDEAGHPMAFFGQFVDPRPQRQNQLVRIFVSDISKEPTAKVLINKLDELKSQILISQPADVPNNGVNTQPMRIVGWKIVNEISPEIWQEAATHHNIPYEELMTRVERKGFDSSSFKVGGFGNSHQGIVYTEPFQNVYAGLWGDAGSLHIDAEGTISGDMG